VQVLQFYPAAISVNVGDAITWMNPTPEIHTVTFLAPGQERPQFNRSDPMQGQRQGSDQIDGTAYLNSGVLELNDSFTATAAQPGAYEYLCLVHELQVGSVVVNPAGTPYQQTQADYDATARAAEPAVAEWQARMSAYQPSMRTRPDGTREHVLSGGMGDGIGATMRFLPQAREVRVGDTITWDNEDIHTPHTVTFGPPQGPPTAEWGNPQAFNGSTPLNSGYFGANWPPGRTYSVTFAAPGVFPYVCLLHTGALMLGTVTVVPGG
jgi:plastocyanin